MDCCLGVLVGPFYMAILSLRMKVYVTSVLAWAGYMGSETILQAIADVMERIKAANNNHVTYGGPPFIMERL